MEKVIINRIQNTDSIELNELKRFQGNLKKQSKQQLEKFKKQILSNGFTSPVFVWGNNILDGHHRIKAIESLQKDGYKFEFGTKIPVVRINAENEERAAKILLGYNSKYADMTTEGLKLYIEDFSLNVEEINLVCDLPISLHKINSYQRISNLIDPEISALPRDEEKIYIKKGDIYALGNHLLLCGDALDAESILKFIGDKCDMLFTDPPYNVDYIPEDRPIGSRARSKNKLGGIINDVNFNIIELIDVISKYVKGAFYICSRTKDAPRIENKIRDILKRESTFIVWAKNNHSIGRRDYHRKHEFIIYNWFGGKYWSGDRTQTDLWEVSRDSVNSYVHPTQKPLELPTTAILNSSPSDGTVLDLFGGSGSTLLAAEQCGRKCYTVELDPYYCQIIIERYQKLTGKPAKYVENIAKDE